jgi:hypothetical protein
MAQDPTTLELAVTRALRDNIVTLQRSADELQQAFADVVASCSSSRPTNSLPPLLRAQTAAAALAASLEVLARFVTSAAQAAPAGVTEAVTRAVSIPVPEIAPAPAPMPVAPPPSVPVPMAEAPAPVEMPAPRVDRIGTGTAHEERREVGMDTIRSYRTEPVPEVAAEAAAPPPPVVEAPAFDVHSLSADEQEMHRRANRHIKVSMQDIKLLRKEGVKLGREQKDLCVRLKDDLDKARKEYERRFRPILGHPVDYFYKWAVEILADGDAEALGEYPYPSPVARR